MIPVLFKLIAKVEERSKDSDSSPVVQEMDSTSGTSSWFYHT